MKKTDRFVFLAPIAVLLVMVISALMSIPEAFLPRTDVVNVIIQINYQIAAIALPCIILAAVTREDMHETLRLRKISPLTALLCALIGVGAMLAFNYVNNVYFVFYMEIFIGPVYVPGTAEESLLSQIGFGISTVVFAPLCEEFLFRGYVQSKYNTRSTVLSIVLTAVLFGLFHMTVYQVFYAFCMGIVLGLISHWTGSIWGSIVAHFMANLFSVVLSLLNSMITFEMYMLMALGGFVLAVAMMVVLYFTVRHERCILVRGKLDTASKFVSAGVCFVMLMMLIANVLSMQGLL